MRKRLVLLLILTPILTALGVAWPGGVPWWTAPDLQASPPPPPWTVTGGSVSASGNSVSVTLASTGTRPSATTAVAGFSVRARPDPSQVWQAFSVPRATLLGETVTLTLAEPVLEKWEAQLSYEAADDPPLALARVSNLSLTNRSTVVRPAAKGRMLLGTRGFARVVADGRNTNKEAQTLFRVEFPYGAAAGWKLTYQGYSDGTRDDVHILAVGVWIQQSASSPLSRHRVTFGGSNAVVVTPGALRESDGIARELLPGARVWVTTWYRPGAAATGLPYQTFLYTRELAGAGTESQDGTLAGPRGTLADVAVKIVGARLSERAVSE